MTSPAGPGNAGNSTLPLIVWLRYNRNLPSGLSICERGIEDFPPYIINYTFSFARFPL